MVIMPRTGGDYVFVSRQLHPLLGFIGNASYGIFLLLFAAINGVTIETTALSTLFAYLGTVYNNPSLTNLASTVSAPTWIIGLGLLWIILGACVAILSTKLYFRIQNLMLILVLIGALAMIGTLVAVSQNSFASAFNAFAAQYMGKSADYYSNVTNTATANGWTLPDTTSLYAGLMFFPLITVGGWYSNYGSQIAGEIRNPKRSYLLGTLAGAALYIGLTAITLAVCYNSMGFNFLSAINYLLYNKPDAIPLPALPYAILLIAIASHPAIGTLIIFTGFLQLFIYIPSAYLYMSRGFFAYSFDRLIPESFAKVSDRTHGPVFAVVICAVISAIFFAIVNIPQSATYAYLFSSVTSVNPFPMITVGLIAILVCIRKPPSYGLLPMKGWKLVLAGLTMICTTIVCMYLLLEEPVYGANTPIALELFLGLFVVLILVYLYAWVRRRDTLSLVFKEIPPE